MAKTNTGLPRPDLAATGGPLRAIRKHWDLYLMALPAIALIVIFKYLPMYGVIIAFKDYNPMQGMLDSEWVGFRFFRELFLFDEFPPGRAEHGGDQPDEAGLRFPGTDYSGAAA
ncbi:hypothetical protein OMP38_18880 [Cohnella ginsengisoli]|uniref:Sugar ABC transporter permease n=1 Tax=Cohnella ginsengisoli TaxID=425004 RepID=A0A9X4QPG4_9BACL|nr:hypothetical protein [Cohnella ginsengisoli]MDG0792710.1 hypothetical protein [Cohnella ginsengisoli]